MANFDEIVQKTAEAAGVVAGKSAVIVKKAADNAKGAVQIGKLNVDIAAEKDRMRRNFSELGKLYYDTHKESPEPELAEIVAEIAASEEKIAEIRSEIELVRATARTEEAEYTVVEEPESEAGDDTAAEE